MSMRSSRRLRGARAGLALLATVLIQAAALTAPAGAMAAKYDVYSVWGHEIWYAPTNGKFLGAGSSRAGDLSAWYASIDHSIEISPKGKIEGGYAQLYRVDGVRIRGTFLSGTVRQTRQGPNCTDESHSVSGALSDVTRSDRPRAKGFGFFDAELVHHRAWVLGRCLTYSAWVAGTISVAF